MLVEKANGDVEEFKIAKLRRSLHNAGASEEEIKNISHAITTELYDGIKTAVIYRRAFALLRQSEKSHAARYSLRRALFSLGPTGFPFEDFLARLFAAEGFETYTRLTVAGACATHEIDIAAFKKDSCFLAEAKFHSRPGIKSDLQVLLYSYARFLDLKDKKAHRKDACGIKQSLVVTNTKFTKTAVAYAQCVGLQLLSWNYPRDNSLQKRIEKHRLFPITVLTSLTQKQKQVLLGQGTILCRDILDKRSVLRSVGLSSSKIESVVTEAEQLCAPR